MTDEEKQLIQTMIEVYVDKKIFELERRILSGLGYRSTTLETKDTDGRRNKRSR